MAEKVIDRFVTEYLFRTDNRALSDIERRVSSIRQGLNRTSRQFMLAGTAMLAPLAGVARGAYTTDKALKRLEARSRANADQLARLKQQAYDVGAALPLDTADILKAQTAYIQLGNSIEDTFADIPTVAKLAVAAEGVSVEDVARYLSIAKNTYKLTNEQVRELGDQMLTLETITAGTLRGMGEGFQYSAQSVADGNVSMREYVSLLGVIAGGGREVESVSQGLNTAFTKVATAVSGFGRGGKLVTKAFKNIRIEVEEVRGLMERPGGFIKLLRLMEKRAPNQPALTASLRALFGETYAAAFSYVLQNLDKLDAALEATANAAGEADRQAAIAMSGYSGGIDSAMAQLDTLVNKLADLELAKPIEDAARAFSAFVGWLIEVDDEGRHVRRGTLALIGNTMKMGVVFLGVGVALRALSWTLGGYVALLKAVRFFTTGAWKATVLYTAWTRISTAAIALQATAIRSINVLWFLLSTAMGRAVLMSKLYVAWTKTATAVQAAYNAVLAINPFVAITLGIIALVAAIVWLVKNWDTLIERLKKWNALQKKKREDKRATRRQELTLKAQEGDDATRRKAQAELDKMDRQDASLEQRRRTQKRIFNFLGWDKPDDAAGRPKAQSQPVEPVPAAARPAGPKIPGLTAAQLAQIPGLTAPLPAPAPVAPALAGAGGTTIGPRSYEFNIDLKVEAPGADSEEIAQNVTAVTRDQLQGLVDDADRPDRL